MFINKITSSPIYVKGKKFIDKTVKSKFDKNEVTITTTYVDGQAAVKQYIFKGKDKVKHYLKVIRNIVTGE